MHYSEKQSALASLASALQAAGWTLYQFHPPVCNPVGDYEPARWYGHAEHKHFPGLKLVSANFSPTYGNYEGHPRTSTPCGCLWHIEQHGQVVAQGKGYANFSYNSKASDHQAVIAAITAACRQLTAAAAAQAAAQSPQGIAANTATPVAITADGNWLWVKFAQKPDELVRVQLKQLGGSFSKRRQAWYFTSPQYLDQLRTLFPVATPQ
jgi:hypothetical protein